MPLTSRVAHEQCVRQRCTGVRSPCPLSVCKTVGNLSPQRMTTFPVLSSLVEPIILFLGEPVQHWYEPYYESLLVLSTP